MCAAPLPSWIPSCEARRGTRFSDGARKSEQELIRQRTNLEVNLTPSSEPVSALSALLPLGLSAGALLSLLLCLLYAPFWLWSWSRGRLARGARRVRVWPLLASACLFAHLGLMLTLDVAALGRFGLPSIALWLSMLAFALFSVLAVVTFVQRWRAPMGHFQRWHSLAASLGGLWLSAWMTAFGYVGTPCWL